MRRERERRVRGEGGGREVRKESEVRESSVLWWREERGRMEREVRGSAMVGGGRGKGRITWWWRDGGVMEGGGERERE